MGIARKGSTMAMPEDRNIAWEDPSKRILIMPNENTTRVRQYDKKQTKEYRDKQWAKFIAK